MVLKGDEKQKHSSTKASGFSPTRELAQDLRNVGLDAGTPHPCPLPEGEGVKTVGSTALLGLARVSGIPPLLRDVIIRAICEHPK